jgi:hypothetical protein
MNRLYVTSKMLAELRSALTPRQHQVLTTLDRVRLATSLQLERLHFTDVSRRQARRALTRMTHQRLLLRLPRIVGGPSAGSGGYVFGLDTAGARLIADDGKRRQPWSIGLPFLNHTLAVTELYVRLVEAHRLGALELTSFTSEPKCWRRFAGPGGGRVTLKPDANVVTRLGKYEDRWLLEVDRGTEPPSTLKTKCEQYRRYWQTGTEQARTGIFPRVLFVVPNAKRVAVLVDVFGKQPTQAWDLFRVTVFDEAVTTIAAGADK